MDRPVKILIRSEFSDTAIGFNNSGVVLKNRSYADLIDLGIMTHRSGDPGLLKLFEVLPTLEDLKKIKMDLAIEKTIRDG